MPGLKKLLISILFVPASGLYAQPPAIAPDSTHIAAGEEYRKSGLYQLFWGKNWREEWIIPVRVPVVHLDTVFGGLTPYRKGGGNETKSLRLKSASGKEYVIRSVNKSRKAVIPTALKYCAVGHIIQDNVSMSHPYGALALAHMLEEAEIYHTHPTLVYIPSQPALDTFNDLFANDLYILEERPDGDWSDAPHLGNFKKFYSTLDVIETLNENKEYRADQKTYIKARLFDILVGDWDKHHDNWKWGKDEERKMFVPIPRDRDQALSTREGILNTLYTSASGLHFIQPFRNKLKSVAALTSQDRKMDRIFARDMQLDDWLHAAALLQQRLTDSVITRSVMQLPAEVFAISGEDIIRKLIARRNDLHLYAQLFHQTIAEDIKVNGDKPFRPKNLDY